MATAGMSAWQAKLAALKQQKAQQVGGGGATTAPVAHVATPVQQQQQQQTAATTKPATTPSPPPPSMTTTTAVSPVAPGSREAILQRAGSWRTRTVSDGHPAQPQPTSITPSSPPPPATHATARPVAATGPQRPVNPPPAKLGTAPTAAAAAATSGHQRSGSSADDIRRRAQMWTTSPAAAGTAPPPPQQPAAAPTKPAVTAAMPSPSPMQPSSPQQPMRMAMGAGAGRGDRELWRQSRRMVRQSRVFATSQLSSIMENITMLERTIAAVEAARQLAEENVIEIAVAKMEEDERVISIAERLGNVIRTMDAMSPAELRAALTSVHEGLVSNVPKGEPLSGATLPAQQTPTPAAETAGDAIPAAPVPPPPPPMPEAGLLMPPQMPGKVALLEQIRNGQKLRKVDVDRLKMEQRRAWKQEARKSVMMRAQLEDTIRRALQTKFALGQGEDGEDDDAGGEEEDVWA